MQTPAIDAVLARLDAVIAQCRTARDPLGFFPALYRQVTVRVKQGIDAPGTFVDGPRMDAFDAAFADRFLTAHDAFRAGAPTSQCWSVAFTRTASRRLIILQDLLLGMNAHINFDLGVTAADTFTAATLPSFRSDFDAINDILAALLPKVEATVCRFSPMLGVLAQVGGTTATEALDFSMATARTDAWLHATLLCALPAGVRTIAEEALDDKVAFLGKVVAQPIGPASAAVALVRETENQDVVAIIDALSLI